MGITPEQMEKARKIKQEIDGLIRMDPRMDPRMEIKMNLRLDGLDPIEEDDTLVG